jgi:hypothetical protein
MKSPGDPAATSAAPPADLSATVDERCDFGR